MSVRNSPGKERSYSFYSERLYATLVGKGQGGPPVARFETVDVALPDILRHRCIVD
jgi:hypothetical protein